MRKMLLLAVLCPWVFFGMFQDSTAADGFWWKPIRTVKTAEECRAMVKTATGRPTIGLISWYHFPYKAETAPAWLKEVMALKPVGGVEPWIGCLPSGYDPHERR